MTGPSAHTRRAWLAVSTILCALCLPHSVMERSWAQTTEKLVRFEQEDLWGYKNSSGQVVIMPQFVMAEDFSSEGIAAVADVKGWAYIDQRGNVVVRPVNYDNGPDPFAEGMARCIGDNGEIGFFDKKGRIVIQPQFGSAFPFQEGLAAVCTGCRSEKMGDAHVVRGGRWGYINHKGAIVIRPQFDYAFSFEKGQAKVCMGCTEEAMGEHSHVTGGSWGSIDKQGKIVVPLRPHQM